MAYTLKLKYFSLQLTNHIEFLGLLVTRLHWSRRLAVPGTELSCLLSRG